MTRAGVSHRAGSTRWGDFSEEDVKVQGQFLTMLATAAGAVTVPAASVPPEMTGLVEAADGAHERI